MKLNLLVFSGLIIYPILSNSAPVPSYGTWLSYFPVNRIYNLQFNNSGQYLGPMGVKQVPDSLPRYDIYNGVGGNVCSSNGNVEEFKVKTCAMTNNSTGAVSSAQFFVLLGVRNPLSPTRYLIQVPTVGGKKAAEFYWDNNRNNVIDGGDTGYTVSCPNYGQPYALLQMDIAFLYRLWNS
jgi:hypothetical protein